MKIAILGSVALPVPPPAQGGTEWMAYYQAKGLSERGHEVILFAAKGSKKDNYELVEVGKGDTVAGSETNAVILGTKEERTPESDSGPDYVKTSTGRQARMTNYTESSRKLRKENVYLAQVLQQLIDRKDDYDIILNNMRGEAIFLPVARLLNKPFVNVMHLPIFQELAEIFKEYHTHVITISEAQKKDYPDLNYLSTVNNCVDTDKYVMLNSFQHPQQDHNFADHNGIPKQVRNDMKSDYLLMMGSIAPHKNQAGAIRVAKKLGMKLILAGKINNQDYFDTIKADIDGTEIKWIGELAFPEKLMLYQKAKAFIFPILWQEPFGLVMIEAMACGTPVVAFNNGAIPEVVVDRKTGFVIDNNSEEKMIEAVKNINSINRTDCRKDVEENFSVEKMVRDYETALTRI